MYIVEGNIGVGKSTFIQCINQQDPTIRIVPEPKEQWITPVNDESLLDNFYKNPSRWAFTIETLAMICRSRDHIRLQEEAYKERLIERSLYSGHLCFAQNGQDQGFFSPLEWQLYNEWVKFLVARCTPPRGFIYLRATPEVCFERIKTRNRESEGAISLEYIKQIHTWHERFLIDKQHDLPSIAQVPVLVLDCSTPFAENPAMLTKHLAALNNFFKAT